MPTSKNTRKKSRTPVEPVNPFVKEGFYHTVEDSERLTLDAYMRLQRYKDGYATLADRQTLMIRLYAGRYLLNHFVEADRDQELYEALLLVNNSRTENKKDIRLLTAEEYDQLSEAIALVDVLFEESCLRDHICAYKEGEDKVILGSDKTQYVLTQL